MPAYVVAELTVPDMEKLAHYAENVPSVVEKFGGRYLVRGGEVDVKEGALGHPIKVILEFPDAAAARKFYDSSDYAGLKKERIAVSEGNLMIWEGV